MCTCLLDLGSKLLNLIIALISFIGQLSLIFNDQLALLKLPVRLKLQQLGLRILASLIVELKLLLLLV